MPRPALLFQGRASAVCDQFVVQPDFALCHKICIGSSGLKDLDLDQFFGQFKCANLRRTPAMLLDAVCDEDGRLCMASLLPVTLGYRNSYQVL